MLAVSLCLLVIDIQLELVVSFDCGSAVFCFAVCAFIVAKAHWIRTGVFGLVFTVNPSMDLFGVLLSFAAIAIAVFLLCEVIWCDIVSAPFLQWLGGRVVLARSGAAALAIGIHHFVTAELIVLYLFFAGNTCSYDSWLCGCGFSDSPGVVYYFV